MRKKRRIVRSTAKEAADMVRRGEDRTDWKRVDAMSQEEVNRRAQEEDGPLPEDWRTDAIIGLPPPKMDIHIRLDADVVDWFRRRGRGYQMRINNVLRVYVASRRGAAGHR